MAKLVETLLLLALPASGKSEVRKLLAGLSPAQCREEFGIGPTVQLDDFPYVHFMRCVDDALAALGSKRVFFHSPDRPFQDSRDWRTLIELVNEDHADLVCGKRAAPKSAALWLMDRIDAARSRFGASPALGLLPARTREAAAAHLEKEARALLEAKLEGFPETLEGKTILIEFARGGPDGSKLPLSEPLGYQGSIPCLSPSILEHASVLYIWVMPEESRRKNVARTDPNDPGSILHHGVPHEVMMKEYGLDDMDHLLNASGKASHIKLQAYGREYLLPVARFDNRVDKTSFIREPREKWDPKNVQALHAGLREAFGRLR